jgi:hypothetical protein
MSPFSCYNTSHPWVCCFVSKALHLYCIGGRLIVLKSTIKARGIPVTHLHGPVGFGLVAQLVERFYGIEEAAGSNPVESTGSRHGEIEGSIPFGSTRNCTKT